MARTKKEELLIEEVETMQVDVANDLGNGRAKMELNGASIMMPTAMVRKLQHDLHKPEVFSNKEEEAAYVTNLLDHLDVVIQSPAVTSVNGRILVGAAAFNSTGVKETFDVNSFGGKSKTDLHLVTTLSTIAGFGVVRSYQQNGELPKELSLTVDMTTALPITEGKKQGVQEFFQSRYEDNVHLVTFHNFKELIHVKIEFVNVIVALEGEAAQYELKNADEELALAIKADFDKSYPVYAGEVTAQDIVTLPNVLGIDIGEGTVDFPVFSNGRLNISASRSLYMGYGQALEQAIVSLAENGTLISSRMELQDTLMAGPSSPLKRTYHNTLQNAVLDQLPSFATKILQEASTVIRGVADSIDVIFVYGGGAAPMTDVLRYDLMNKTKEFRAEGIPVIFVPAPYAQQLNKKGLGRILRAVKSQVIEV